MSFTRVDGRRPDELRPVKITRDYIMHAEGSVLIELGNTKVICTATIEDRVPHWLRGKEPVGLRLNTPCCHGPRVYATKGNHRRVGSGRTHEIQRLIGRSLRSIIDLKALGERTIWLDCDVIQADGGTRTAAITGAYIALTDALRKLPQPVAVQDYLAAISLGIVDGQVLLDLCYEEDFAAQLDMNVVMTGSGKIVEIQGTAETAPFSREELNALLDLAKKGILELVDMQKSLFMQDLSKGLGGR